MKIHFINIGCKVNFVELSRLKEIFKNLNYIINDKIEDSDIVLINTCSVTNKAAADSRKLIRRVRKINPNSFIGVLGCYAQLNPEEIIKNTEADAVFGINEKFNIAQIIQEKIQNKNILNNKYNSKIFVSPIVNKFDYAYSGDSESRTRAIIKLQDGCNYKCSYCTIPLARGNSRSINFDNILPQIKEIYNSGFKEIVLTGINLSDYNYNNKNFYDILKLISKLELSLRFRISSIEPHIITNELLDIIINSKNICPHFHIPLQSGCDEILKKMRRRYNTDKFRKYIELINSYMPNASIGLDVIIGFPTENNNLFEETYNFINSLNITYLHCFSFSKRDNTEAYTMLGQVDNITKKYRINELLKISKQKTKQYYEKNLNNILTLLPEKSNIEKEKYIIIGHTENYIPIILKYNKSLNNDFYKIQLNSINSNNNNYTVNATLIQ